MNTEKERTAHAEMLGLLAMMQHFQWELAGRTIVSLTTHFDEDGLWLTFSCMINGEQINGQCYPFYSYDENLENVNDFKERVKKSLER